MDYKDRDSQARYMNRSIDRSIDATALGIDKGVHENRSAAPSHSPPQVAEGSIEEISALLSAHLPLFAASVHVEARRPPAPRYKSARTGETIVRRFQMSVRARARVRVRIDTHTHTHRHTHTHTMRAEEDLTGWGRQDVRTGARARVHGHPDLQAHLGARGHRHVGT
jgi:hypothetical protein